MNANIFNSDELSEAFTLSDAGGVRLKGSKNHGNSRFSSSILGAQSGENLKALLSESASNTTDSDDVGPMPKIKRKRKRGQTKPLWMRVPSIILTRRVIPGPCATSAYNSLLKSTGIKFSYLTAKDLVDGIHLVRENRKLRDGETISQEVGSYVSRKVGDKEFYDSVRVHIRVLNYLVNNVNRNKRVDGRQIRMVRCKNGTTYFGLKWLASQTDGLYILFGYLDGEKCIGHFAGYNAKLLEIYDGNTMATYNFCKDSMDIIFPGRLDCIHQLTFTDLAISAKRIKKSIARATIGASIVDSAQI